MISNGFLVVLFISVLNFQRVSAMKCWRCSSDAANADFCNDPFEETNNFQTQQSYVECLKPKDDSTQRVVCKKVKKLTSQSEVVVRTCHWETENAHRNDCHDEIIKSNGTILFCETCDTDGCNTASMQNQPIVKLILSIFIVKSLMDLFCNKTQ